MGSKNIKKIIIDTNIIVRYLVNDVESQANEVEKLFIKAEKGDIELILLPIVVAETTYVLQNFYYKSLTEISKGLQLVLVQPWLILEHEKALLGLWSWYEKGQHFVDSYLLALEKYEGMEIFSFDKKLNNKRI
jgi:predicted nucleic acid-binding protein